MKKMLIKTRKGGASMFVVMFTVIILSIITLSFTRLIISEATKTSNTDLSQSAYDSALAGIEDAKVALLRYHACLDQGYRKGTASSSNECERLIYYMQEGIADQDCSTVANVLRREQSTDTHGVVVQETQKSTDSGNNSTMLQAYTCVTIQEELPDYRTTLTSNSRLRIIPIRSSVIDKVDKITLRWFSDVNATMAKKDSGSSKSFCGNDTFASYDDIFKLYPRGNCNGKEQAPPFLTVRLIQTDETFDLSELSSAKSANKTDTGQLYFLPSNTSCTTSIASTEWGKSADKAENKVTQVRCSESGDFWCSVDLALPETFKGYTTRSDANTYLLVSIPYGTPDTDLSAKIYAGSSLQQFTGVQARVDSTGRANDLYRRVETRVELVDTYFAYPEFEITMTGDPSGTLSKTFHATFNCWGADNGSKWGCSDTVEDADYSSW